MRSSEKHVRLRHSNWDVYDRLQPDDLKQASVIVASFVNAPNPKFGVL
jgi:hypothetical protein